MPTASVDERHEPDLAERTVVVVEVEVIVAPDVVHPQRLPTLLEETKIRRVDR
jgi:hypothetical protein